MKKQLLLVAALLSIGIFFEQSVAGSRLRKNQKRQEKKVEQKESEADTDLDIATIEDEGEGGVEEPVVREEEPAIATRDEDAFDIPAKRKQTTALVEQAIDYLRGHEATQAFNLFTHSKDFLKGELYIFAFKTNGVCMAHGEQSDLLWKNLYELRDAFGAPIVKNFIEKAHQGGGWVTYQWRNATKVSYVQEVKKDGITYVVGAGYYPHSKRDAVVNLVKGAAALFNDLKAQNRPKEEAFSTFNYPAGRFVSGSLYLYALDFKGNIMAQADRPGLVGSNSLDYQDALGKFPNQEIINKLKQSPDEGVWVTYTSKRAVKHTYAERVEDSKGNSYFVACGFYPDADRNAAVDLVRKGYTYMKAHGKAVAVQDFSSKTNEEYRYGDLFLVVYDLKGKCIAHGDNSELIGQNFYDAKDDDGRYYIREMIDRGKKGGGWVDFKTKNSFESIYVEEINLGLPENHFVIGCGVFPITKSETMNLLVKSAASYLRTNPEDKTFEDFTDKNGKFIRGDLDVTVFDASGLCYASGDEHDLIWQNMLNAKDDDGKAYVKILINTVKSGAGKVTYKLNGVQKIAYVEKVEKSDKVFVVVSSFFK